jgi:hypothetical protein
LDSGQSNPTYEFWPTRGPPVASAFLADTQPANLCVSLSHPLHTVCIRCTDADSAADPLTWLLPNGLLFMQANWQTTLVNYTTSAETRLPNITKAQKTYPATGAIAMLPLTVENGFQPTLLFCGGMDPVRDE